MTLCWCVFNGIVGQINVTCNIHINFDSGLTYSNNIKCLMCGFPYPRSSKFFLRENAFRWNREREREREREFGLVYILSELGLWTKDYMKSHTVAIRL